MNTALHTQALSLPLSERAELAHVLLQSLEFEDPGSDAHEADIQQQWLELAARRADELDRGVVQGIPADEVFAKARALASSTRAQLS